MSAYAPWEQQLKALEPKGWEVLKSKASPYLQRRDKKRRGQLFDALGEAIAFNYLKESVGCSSVRFIPESDNPTPDLEGFTDGARVLCEVKTINISDAEIGARQGPPVARDITGRLTEEFLCKLDKTVANAKSQLRSFDPTGDAQHLACIAIRNRPCSLLNLQITYCCSYSIDTIEKVRGRLATDDKLFFVIGADAFAEIESWRRWRDVVAAVEFIVVSRPGHKYRIPPPAIVHSLETVDLAVSSSEIRRKLAAGDEHVDVPEAVLEYIRARGLYHA